MPYKDSEKQKEYQRLWKAKRREEFFADKSCVQCGSVDRMELDHVDPSTKDSRLKVTPSNLWSWKEENRLIELAKCQVLCYDCHKKKTINELADPNHGVNQYKRGCRCDICRACNAAERRLWRLNKKLRSNVEL